MHERLTFPYVLMYVYTTKLIHAIYENKNLVINKKKKKTIKHFVCLTLKMRVPMPCRKRSSSAFYNRRTLTLEVFVKKNVKMYSVVCQLSVKQILGASF